MTTFSDGPTAMLATAPAACDQPERRLLLAILEDAIATLRSPHRMGEGGPRAWIEARSWIASNDADWPFAYVNVCAMLGIDPEYLRRGLLADPAVTPPERFRSRARLHSGSRTRVTLDRSLRRAS